MSMFKKATTFFKKHRSKLIFIFVVFIALVVMPPFFRFGDLKSPLTVSSFFKWYIESIKNHPLGGFLQSFSAGIVLALAAWLFRFEIKNFFHPKLIYMHAPLMLGVAPIIIARPQIFEQNNLTVDFDFRYAGAAALKSLFSPKSQVDVVVASEVAIASFLGKEVNRKKEVTLIPFVRIEDHLKILVRTTKKNGVEELEYKTFEDLQGKNIGYYEDSVHYEFLLFLHNQGKERDQWEKIGNLVPMKSVLQCYHELINTKDIHACVLWEPHYYAFDAFSGISVMEKKEDEGQETDKPESKAYEWFLCLVATRDYVESNDTTATNILRAMEQAVNYCEQDRHVTDIIDSCQGFLHTEFTGIKEEDLKHLFTFPRRRHIFAISDNIEKFKSRSRILGEGTGLSRASELSKSLWPGLD